MEFRTGALTLIAFALLTGARDDSIASLAVRHVDIVGRTVFQDARSVRTKNRKNIVVIPGRQ